MNSRAFISFVFIAFLALLYVVATAAQLPEALATHFGPSGRADGWMTRDGYLLFTICFLLGLPLLVSFFIGFLPQRWPNLTNIPHRDYWLAPERREESVRYLAAHGWWLGCLMVMLVASMHYAIIEANRNQPPTLSLIVFLPMIGGFIAGMLVWVVTLYRRFRKEV